MFADFAVAFHFQGAFVVLLTFGTCVGPSAPQRHGMRVGRRVDASTWQAMQQLHPILAQTECEEAARPKAGHRNTPDPRHPKTSQDPRGVFFFACFIQKNTCLSCKLCGCYVDDVDVDGVDMCRSQVH